MAWEKPSPELTRILEEALTGVPCERKIMFGCPAWRSPRGQLFAGVHQNSLFLRLSPSDREALAAEYPGSGPFEPMAGRPMKEYRVLPPELFNDPERLGEWIVRALQFAESL